MPFLPPNQQRQSTDATATKNLIISCLIKIQTVLPFRYWLTKVVLEKRLLNRCSSVVKSDVEECAVTGRIHHVTSSVISAHEYTKVPSFCVAKITRHKPEADGKSVGMPLPTHVQMDGQPEHILPLDSSIALMEALTLGMPQFCAKTEDSARVIFTNSAQRFCIFSANSAHFFRKEKNADLRALFVNFK